MFGVLACFYTHCFAVVYHSMMKILLQCMQKFKYELDLHFVKKKIRMICVQNGVYHIPPWLSQESIALLRLMLQVDPTRRIRIDDLLKHRWLINNVYPEPVKHDSIYQV